MERVALREQYNAVATGKEKVEMREETDKWDGASKAGRCEGVREEKSSMRREDEEEEHLFPSANPLQESHKLPKDIFQDFLNPKVRKYTKIYASF